MRRRILYLFSLLKGLNIDWEKWSKRGDQGYQIAWRLLISTLVIGFLWFIISGLKDNGYSIQAFNMPKSFEDAGYSGPVMARKLVDELSSVQSFISSVKENELENIQNANDKPDLDVEVMGIGLTLNSITYHLRELLGRPNRSIGGEITDIDSILTLNLRVTGAPVQNFSYDYSNTSRVIGLDSITYDAAKAIIQFLDPYRMAVYHQRNGDFQSSLKVINYILREKKEDTDWAYVAWGNLLDKQGDLVAAAEKFEQATIINPKLVIAWRNWAWLELRQKNNDLAIDLMRKSLNLDKTSAEGWNSLAFCLKQTEQFAESEKAYKNAIKHDPTNIDWYNNYAEFKGMQGDTSAVVDIFQKMQKNIDLKDAGYFTTIASYYRFTGDLDKAALCLNNALDLDPDNLVIHNQLSNYYFQIEEDRTGLKHARKVIQLASSSDQNNADFIQLQAHNNIAMSFYQEEEFDSAYYHANQAISINPEVNFPHSTLAETHGLAGNDEGFYEAIERAIELGFDVTKYLDQAPYDKYKNQERFIQLMDKYNEEKGD